MHNLRLQLKPEACKNSCKPTDQASVGNTTEAWSVGLQLFLHASGFNCSLKLCIV